MKILFISTVYPNPDKPTFGVFVHEQAKQLTKLGVDIRVICPISITPPLRLLKLKKGILGEWKSWFFSIWNTPKEYTFEGIKIFYPCWILLPKVLEMPTLFYFKKKFLNRIWRDGHWDVVHAHFLTPNGILAKKIAHEYGIPMVISCLGTDLFYYAKRKTVYASAKLALLSSGAIICKSTQLLEAVIQFGVESKRVHVIYNGCDLVEFNTTNTKKFNEILYVGQFIESKCLEYLIEAFSNLQNKEVKLRLLGGGELLPQIKKTVYDYALQDRVIFEGTVLHSLLPKYMNEAKLLCLPSRSEGTPNVVMEALACGTPVVATKVGGVPDIVPSCCGILVPPKNAIKLQRALNEALERDWDYQAIRLHAEQKLSSEAQCNKIIEIYNNQRCQPNIFPETIN